MLYTSKKLPEDDIKKRVRASSVASGRVRETRATNVRTVCTYVHICIERSAKNQPALPLK